jgi:integrase
VSDSVVPLRPVADVTAAAGSALAAVHRHLDRCKLSANTVKAYKRQTAAYAAWLAGHAADHGDAYADLVGAEGAVTAWRRDMITARSSPSKVNQALAAVTLMYEQAGIRIAVKRVRIPRPGEPGALTPGQEGAVRRAAVRRGPRDAAIIAVLLDAGARVEECARLDAGDFAITARTGEVRLHGKGDEVRFVPLSRRARDLVSAWLDERGRHPAPPGTGSAARSPSPASPRSCWPPAPTPASPACDPTAAVTPSARASARAAPTLPRSKPSSGTPPSTPRPVLPLRISRERRRHRAHLRQLTGAGSPRRRRPASPSAADGNPPSGRPG